MNNFLFSQNIYLIFVSLLNIAYLFRLWKHISIRTSFIIAPIIIFPFLTSIYKNTFISFLLNPNLVNFSFTNLENILRSWFGGSPESIFLIGIFFLGEKISLAALSPSVLLELWLISIGLCSFIIKVIGLSQGYTLLLGILIPIIIHTYKRKKQFINFFDLRKNKIDIPFLNKRDFVRVISGLLFFLLIFISNQSTIQFSIINLNHVARIFIFMGLFLGLLIQFKAYNKKIIMTYIPVLLLFAFFSLANLFDLNPSNQSYIYKLNCIITIAFLPLVEYIYVLFFNLNSKIKTSSIISVKTKRLLILYKIMIGFLAFSYINYVLASS